MHLIRTACLTVALLPWLAQAADESYSLHLLWSDEHINAMWERGSANEYFDPRFGAQSFTGSGEMLLRKKLAGLSDDVTGFNLESRTPDMLLHAFAEAGVPLTQVETSVHVGVNARAVLDRLAAQARERRSREITLAITLDARIIDDGRALYLRGYVTATRGGRSRHFASGALHWISAPVPGDDAAARMASWSKDGGAAFRTALADGLTRIARMTAMRLRDAKPQRRAEQLRFADHIATLVDVVDSDDARVVYALPPNVLVDEPWRSERDLLDRR